MHHPRNADLFEDVCKDRLPNDEIFVPPQHQPINPEDEDDVVPDQHAAFGIQRATQAVREPAWKDLGLSQLMRRGPRPGGRGGAPTGGPSGAAGAGMGNAADSGASAANPTNSYGYYAYYYGYNANGIGASLAGAAGGNVSVPAGPTNDPAASPGGVAARGQAGGAGTRNYRGMPR